VPHTFACDDEHGAGAAGNIRRVPGAEADEAVGKAAGLGYSAGGTMQNAFNLFPSGSRKYAA
jgi:hypothetical protein